MSSLRKVAILLTAISLLLAVSAVLAAATSFSGVISSGAQTDIYPVFHQAGTSVIADLTCDDPATLDPVLSLYNSNGTQIAYNDDGGIKHCNAFWSSRIVYTFSESGTYYWHVDGFGSSSGPYTLRIQDSVVGFVPSDDRINPHAFAPVAVYCRAAGTVDVWNIDAAGQGTPLLSVAAADQAAGASAGAVSLSTLPDGRLQVSAPMLDGKGYLFIFNGCPATASETYTVENGNAVLFETRAYGN